MKSEKNIYKFIQFDIMSYKTKDIAHLQNIHDVYIVDHLIPQLMHYGRRLRASSMEYYAYFSTRVHLDYQKKCLVQVLVRFNRPSVKKPTDNGFKFKHLYDPKITNIHWKALVPRSERHYEAVDAHIEKGHYQGRYRITQKYQSDMPLDLWGTDETYK